MIHKCIIALLSFHREPRGGKKGASVTSLIWGKLQKKTTLLRFSVSHWSQSGSPKSLHQLSHIDLSLGGY